MGKGEPANGTDDLARLDAVGLAEAIRKGDLSPVESVQPPSTGSNASTPDSTR